MKKILFVCTGNTCRSPIAQGLFQKMVGYNHEYDVASAGLHAVLGLAASSLSLAVLAEQGIDFSRFRSQPVTSSLIEQATHVFTMTQNHLRELIRLYPQHQKKFFLLNEGITTNDISDPIGGNLETYQECCETIQHALDNILTLLRHNTI